MLNFYLLLFCEFIHYYFGRGDNGEWMHNPSRQLLLGLSYNWPLFYGMGRCYIRSKFSSLFIFHSS
jgi:hypothetical protein